MIERLRTELAAATAELTAHLHSWEYAYAMGASCHGGADHPILREARARTARLEGRCGDPRARLAEHEQPRDSPRAAPGRPSAPRDRGGPTAAKEARHRVEAISVAP